MGHGERRNQTTRRKKSVSGETLADFAQESHRIGDKIDRVRDMDDLITRGHIHFLDLTVPHVNAHFPVHLRNRGVRVDPFCIPAVVSEFLHSFAKTAGDVEKAPSTGSGERCKHPQGARRNCAGGGTAAGPNMLQFRGGEARRALVL